MRVKFERLGYVDSADIETGGLTVICGANNTGKTYLAYAIYGLLKFWPHAVDIFHHEEEMSYHKSGNLAIEVDLGFSPGWPTPASIFFAPRTATTSFGNSTA